MSALKGGQAAREARKREREKELQLTQRRRPKGIT
jgi:hypothetical protein